jgi:hypothetical protein
LPVDIWVAGLQNASASRLESLVALINCYQENGYCPLHHFALCLTAAAVSQYRCEVMEELVFFT